MEIHAGEVYGKQTSKQFVMYNVVKIKKGIITLQNIDNPLSLFESTSQKLLNSGYIRISQTPYINTEITGKKKKRAARKPTRCPNTVDFIEARADTERPTPIFVDLFDN